MVFVKSFCLLLSEVVRLLTKANQGNGERGMKLLQFIKRHRAACAAVLLLYALSYGFVRRTQMLVHQVSYAGDVYYHTIIRGDRYLWSPVGYFVPVSY